MHTYDRKTGRWTNAEGVLLGIGFSGLDDGDGVLEPGEGLNAPEMEKVKGVGPLPAGVYWISVPFQHPVIGQFIMRLDPMPGTPMFGRSGFLIHGGSRKVAGTSRGCIVLDRPVREAIRASGDNKVQVV
jgi:hypothetical protein